MCPVLCEIDSGKAYKFLFLQELSAQVGKVVIICFSVTVIKTVTKSNLGAKTSPVHHEGKSGEDLQTGS